MKITLNTTEYELPNPRWGDRRVANREVRIHETMSGSLKSKRAPLRYILTLEIGLLETSTIYNLFRETQGHTFTLEYDDFVYLAQWAMSDLEITNEGRNYYSVTLIFDVQEVT
jgi:hypothetical protein